MVVCYLSCPSCGALIHPSSMLFEGSCNKCTAHSQYQFSRKQTRDKTTKERNDKAAGVISW